MVESIQSCCFGAKDTVIKLDERVYILTNISIRSVGLNCTHPSIMNWDTKEWFVSHGKDCKTKRRMLSKEIVTFYYIWISSVGWKYVSAVWKTPIRCFLIVTIKNLCQNDQHFNPNHNFSRNLEFWIFGEIIPGTSHVYSRVLSQKILHLSS